MIGLTELWMNSGQSGNGKKKMDFKLSSMGTKKFSIGRNFQSYLDEYLLQTTEAEINAFWKRIDEVMKKMPIDEKTQFFQDLINGIDESVEDSKMLRKQLTTDAR